MKKLMIFALCLALALSMAGCGTKSASEPTPASTASDFAGGMTFIGNPWQYFDTLAEAEAAAGFACGVPEVIADDCRATAFGVMTSGDAPLLEVTYLDGAQEITLRKSAGEGQEISGVYGLEKTETTERAGVTVTHAYPAEASNAVLTSFDYDGFSWSLYAPDGYSGDRLEDFLRAIFG